MYYAFIDESGDIGFSEKSTRYYIVACLETRQPDELSAALKRARKKLGKKLKNIPEFKFSQSSHKVRCIVIEELLKKEWEFSAVVLDKTTVYDHLRDHKQIIHNYITGFIVEVLPLNHDKLILMVDKSFRRDAINEFNGYLRKKVNWITWERGIDPPALDIRHDRSENHAGLQAADFVAGSLFSKYERGNDFYYKLIEPRKKVLKVRF